MAKYTITYRCGHQAEVQLFGPYAERERKIAYYATIDCPSCRADESSRLAEKSGLPVLSGSEKQVSWASDIRNEFVSVASEIRTRCAGNESNPQVAEVLAKIETVLAKPEARFWIDNRNELSDAKFFIASYKSL